MLRSVADMSLQIGEEPAGIYEDDRNGRQYACYKATLGDGRIIYLSASLFKGLKEHDCIVKQEG